MFRETVLGVGFRAGLTGLSLLAAADSPRAQSDDERVVHLWVGPRYGNDALAAGPVSLNPNGNQTIAMQPGCPSNPCQPTGLRPNDIVDPNNKVLLNAPYPFKTIRAAIDYINAIPGLAGAPLSTPPLPYGSATTGWTWKHAIIHLLPGIYGSDSVNHHPDNGLIANGEQFPLFLPRNVSIQGTSALNTFFDLRGETAFIFGAYVDPATGQRVSSGGSLNTVPIDGTNSFISSVTFFGGGKPAGPQTLGTEQAAILIDDEVDSHPTIVNCFFLKNYVGILVNASVSSPATELPQFVHDGTTIVSNTFFGNGIGIWNGQHAEQTASPTMPFVYGWSKLNIVNNIFDGTVAGQDLNVSVACSEALQPNFPANPNTWPFYSTDSAFEGIADEDMKIETSPTSDVYEDFNAYERAVPGGVVRENYNRSQAIPGNPWIRLVLSNTLVRPGKANPLPVASRNIAEITGYYTGPGVYKPRGILYIRDLFCVGRRYVVQGFPHGTFQAFPDVATGPAGHFDGSPHDLRLCPTASISDPQALSPPNTQNPLVDNGYGGGYPATMQNGQQVARPGALTLGSASQWSWQFDPLAFDCEGWGNSRVYDHPSFPNQTGRPSGWEWIDVGADEVADDIVAGYRFATTMFVWLDELDPANKIYVPTISPPTPMANNLQWYIGPVTNATGMAPPSPLHPAFAQEQPRFRAYGFQAWYNPATSDFPLTYLGPDGGRTWHSTETTALPLVYARPWRFDLTTLPPPQAPACGTPYGINDMSRATAADIVPHLLPDIHPWWTQQFNGLAPPTFFSGYAPPSNALWQPCLGLGNYNSFLYDYGTQGGALYPSTNVINPPGTYGGHNLGGWSFQWLDGWQVFQSGPPLFVRFNDWEAAGGPYPLVEFDHWCRGSDALPPPQTHFEHRLLVSDPIAIRFSLEFNGVGPFGTEKNVQSFLVLIKEDQP